MKPMHFAMALLSAAMFFVLASVFMGVQLELDGTKLVVANAGTDIRWQWIFIGSAVVFVFQLLRPLFQRASSNAVAKGWCCRVLTVRHQSKSC